MKAIVALFLTIALINATYVGKHPLDFGKRRNIMQVMLEVESRLKTNSPLDTIQGVLSEFKNAVNEEQIDHDDVYNQQKGECDSEIAYRVSEITDATATLRDANGQLKTCNLQKNKSEAQLGRNDETLVQNRQHLDLINDVRRQETSLFNKGAVVFNNAVNAIDDCLDLCAHISTEGAFVQLGKQSGVLLTIAVKLQKTQLFKPVLAQIAALTQEGADQAAVERLVSLLGTLRENIENGWADYQTENAESLEAFGEQQNRIKTNIARLEKNELRLKDKIENLSGCIASQTAVAQAASNKLQRNKVLHEDATVLCTVFDNEYTATTAGRRQELVLVAELERLVERRFAEHQG